LWVQVILKKHYLVPKGFTANDTETVVFVIINNELVGYLPCSTKQEPWNSAGSRLKPKQNNIKSILLTGDNNKVAKA